MFSAFNSLPQEQDACARCLERRSMFSVKKLYRALGLKLKLGYFCGVFVLHNGDTMGTRWLHIVLVVLAMMTVANAFAQAPRSSSSSATCAVSKNSKLAMDQRDDARMACLKQKKAQLSVAQCLGVAASMEYTTNGDEARMVCLYDLGSRVSAKECLAITKAIEYPDSGDEARWECIRRFNKSLSTKQCRVFAKAMSYPANAQRAEQYCSGELQ